MPNKAKRLPEGTLYCRMDSPVGELILLAEDAGLTGVVFDNESDREEMHEALTELEEQGAHPILVETKRQLGEYFKRKRRTFDLPLRFHGTPFQKRVWERLLEVPYGETVSYQEQAEKLGGRSLVRAVGGANGKNPISIIAPCHRVIGKNGDLTGFGGGLHRKRWLLELEKGQVSGF